MKQVLVNVTLLCGILQISAASIAGVTYMDQFDFEQRYRDVNECNPLYWHPLHLPEKCMEMFEKLIRSGLKNFVPYRIVQERPRLALPSEPMFPYTNIYSPEQYIYKADYDPTFVDAVETRSQSPFEAMFELLRQDIRDLPSAPSLGVSPYLGVVAMYKQPVSYKSVAMIKKLARAYGKAGTFSTTETQDYIKENKEKISAKVTNGSIVVDKIIDSNDAIAYFKIKKIH